MGTETGTGSVTGGGAVGGGVTGVGGVWGAGVGLGFDLAPQVLKFPLQIMRAMAKAITSRTTPKMIQHLAFFHHMWRLSDTAVLLN